jgi:2-iminoacetate synthase ThiH
MHDTHNCQYCNFYRSQNLPIPATHTNPKPQ